MNIRFKVDHRGAVTRQVHAAAAAAVGDACEFLLEEANRTAPIEEAILIGSGIASSDPAALRGAVSYDTPYAVRQHEDLTLRHDPGRRGKWLEATFREQAPRVGQFITDRIRKAAR